MVLLFVCLGLFFFMGGLSLVSWSVSWCWFWFFLNSSIQLLLLCCLQMEFATNHVKKKKKI